MTGTLRRPTRKRAGDCRTLVIIAIATPVWSLAPVHRWQEFPAMPGYGVSVRVLPMAALPRSSPIARLPAPPRTTGTRGSHQPGADASRAPRRRPVHGLLPCGPRVPGSIHHRPSAPPLDQGLYSPVHPQGVQAFCVSTGNGRPPSITAPVPARSLRSDICASFSRELQRSPVPVRLFQD